MKFDVYLLNRLAGLLEIDNERFRFQYTIQYIEDGSDFLSVTMPIQKNAFEDKITFPFFENLLPEGELRHLIAESLKTDSSNFARFLERMGGDVAGAICLLPAGVSPNTLSTPPSAPLTPQDLGSIIKKIQLNPFLTDMSDKMRLSLAGAQNKLPIIVDSEGIKLPGSLPSTHILKPPSTRFHSLVENEFLCMRAAEKAGISVPTVDLLSYIDEHEEEKYCLQISRYDRMHLDGSTHRLHQEDICQVNHIPSPRKYTADGGPDMAILFNTIREHTTQPALNLKALLKRILFNLLIGNCDAHGKNFSLLHHSQSRKGSNKGPIIQLSPAYDLVSTMIYEELSDKLAMPMGECSRIRDIQNDNITIFENDSGINLRRARKEYTLFLEQAFDALTLSYEETIEHCFPSQQEQLKSILVLAKRHLPLLIKAINS